jgi:large subunit ribosomal protein L13
METQFLTKENAISGRKWYLIDAKDQVVGRFASKLASILRGKTSPQFATHNDTGDFVVVINADKIKFTGNKLEGKLYRHHTGYIGGVKEVTAGEQLKKKPEEVIKMAVQGMLPKNPLGRSQLAKLKVYKGENHPHQAQKLIKIEN